jgi:hypothetical protein
MRNGRNGAYWAFGHGGDVQEMVYEDGVKVIGVLGRRIEMGLENWIKACEHSRSFASYVGQAIK